MTDGPYDRNSLDQLEQQALGALSNRDPAKVIAEISALHDGLPTPRDQRALTLVLAMHVHKLAIEQERQRGPTSDAMLRVLFANRACRL